jgi:hypothetical protein
LDFVDALCETSSNLTRFPQVGVAAGCTQAEVNARGLLYFQCAVTSVAMTSHDDALCETSSNLTRFSQVSVAAG